MSAQCAGCRDGQGLDFDISMAFQPIVNTRTGQPFAYEALVRGVDGAGAGSVLSRVDDKTRYAFDQKCRVTAIRLAAKLYDPRSSEMLSINFMPNAVYEPRACIRMTLETAEQCQFPRERIIFEFCENERVDPDHLLKILKAYRSMGFKTAIDDFGAGYSGLNLLAQFQPDLVKLDMELIRNIDNDQAKRKVVRHTLAMLADLGIEPICEGVETAGELQVLQDFGVSLIQGYVLAKPAFERFERNFNLAA
ncbi:EAL domain-containing protein [Rhizobium sp. FKY42]|uniref:EAL domain-containing protein n=1 Tax=Rhizobium sp. FKY42 TaxID=2562310 RepID=UPI0010C143E8|nr:EAL domain-containing protein [Rhizobium sp. FKY42]